MPYCFPAGKGSVVFCISTLPLGYRWNNAWGGETQGYYPVLLLDAEVLGSWDTNILLRGGEMQSKLRGPSPCFSG